jgi:hypothetical protein
MNERIDTIEMKKAINNLVWMYAPGGTTLIEAEKISLTIMAILQGGQ